MQTIFNAMSTQILELTLPSELYKRLEARAKTTARSLSEEALQTLERGLPPPLEDELPPSLRAELKAMEHLSDDTLWRIAQSAINPDKVALYDLLLDRLHTASLTPEGREWLTRLREESEALMLRKAHAYALLQSRGHKLPSLDELRGQTS